MRYSIDDKHIIK